MNLDQKVQNEISSLSEVVSALKSGKYEEVLSQSDNLFISLDEFTPYATWNKQRYTRNCIARNEDFELILLCWEEGQKTAIHCHNEQECWVKVIQGSFVEDLFAFPEKNQQLKFAGRVRVSQNEVTTIDNTELLHSLENTNKGRSMSLHLYMKPITKCRVFNANTKKLEIKSLCYDTLEGKPFEDSRQLT